MAKMLINGTLKAWQVVDYIHAFLFIERSPLFLPSSLKRFIS